MLLVGLLLHAETNNPTRAALYSAALPGAGQVYNHAYYKAGLVIGVQSWLLFNAIKNDNKADDFKQLASHTTDLNSAEMYRQSRKTYQEKRNSDIWWMGITMGLSVLDAWVDAHLSDFDAQKDNIHLRFTDEKLTLEYEF